MSNKIYLFGALSAIILLCGCTGKDEGQISFLSGFNNGGCMYDSIHTIERTIFGYNVYLVHDSGTGGMSGSNFKGSFCVAGSDTELINQITHFAETGERVKICYTGAFLTLGCDYDAIITRVEVIGNGTTR